MEEWMIFAVYIFFVFLIYYHMNHWWSSNNDEQKSNDNALARMEEAKQYSLLCSKPNKKGGIEETRASGHDSQLANASWAMAGGAAAVAACC